MEEEELLKKAKALRALSRLPTDRTHQADFQKELEVR